MKINTSKRYSKILIITTSILVVACLGYVVMAYTNNLFPFIASQDSNSSDRQNTENGVDYNPPTVEQKQAGEDQKMTTAQPSVNSGVTTGGDTLQVTITALAQNGGMVQVRGLIDRVSSLGTCTLTLTKGGASITKESDIQALPSESTCKGFDVPVSELSAGTWSVTLSAQVSSAKGSATKSFAVK
ncbi:MAG TPA: hypothetical protein PK265_00205 [Candidatus Saccharibacteria bacterium]|nr:hypothetical protein [Candidatus Saccharibacteria bacterium]HRQ97735.1 hypothetical protein [Candidatus Saccharibacteria bacterium]